jgi:hypothetical protein
MTDAMELIKQLEGRSDDELFATLGRYEAGATLGIDEQEPLDWAEEGRTWWRENAARCREVLCGEAVISHLTGHKWDRSQLYAAIADLLSAMLTGVPLAVVTLVVVRQGLVAFCSAGAPPAGPKAA